MPMLSALPLTLPSAKPFGPFARCAIIPCHCLPKLFEKQRRLILSASMIAIKGRVQREGEVIHFVTQEFFDFFEPAAHSRRSRAPIIWQREWGWKGRALAPSRKPSDNPMQDPR